MRFRLQSQLATILFVPPACTVGLLGGCAAILEFGGCRWGASMPAECAHVPDGLGGFAAGIAILATFTFPLWLPLIVTSLLLAIVQEVIVRRQHR